jgi:quercetin dioxygenase-like cupin family protein
MKRRWAWALLVVLFGVAAYAGSVLATPQVGVTTSTVAKSLFDEIDLNSHTIPADQWQARLKTEGMSDVYVVDNKFAPGATTGWHSHPGPSLIFVVSGTVTNYHGNDPTCTGQTYSAGQGFVDQGGDDVHMIRNETSTSAETVAVQLLPQGAPRKIDVSPAPQNC